MNQEMFRSGYFLGRLIWLRGETTEAALQFAKELLLSCNTDPRNVWVIGPDQFVMTLEEGVDRLLMRSWFQVLVLKDVELLPPKMLRRVRLALMKLREVQWGAGLRLVLVSRKDSFAELSWIEEFGPVTMDEAAEVEDMNSQVHSLIDQASLLTQIPIHRITERAADFLEDSVRSGHSDEALVLLIEGMRRSDGRVLRFRDLLPNFSPFFDPDDEVKTICN